MSRGDRGDANRGAGPSENDIDRLRTELASARERASGLEQRLDAAEKGQRTAAQEIEALRRKLRFAEESARDAALQLHEIQDSPAWLVANRILGSRLIGGSWRLIKSISPVWLKQEIKSWIRTRGRRQDRAGREDGDSPAGAGTGWSSEIDVVRELDQFLSRVDQSSSADFVVFVAGVKWIETEGQRVTQLIHALIRDQIPVLLVYYRWRAEYHHEIPRSHHPCFFQVPMDLFERCRAQVIERPFRASLHRTFVFEFPHLAVLPWLDALQRTGWHTVYDVIDDWEEFARARKALWYQPEAERSLCARCDAVTAITPPLARKVTEWVPGREVELVPNGVALDSFDTTLPPVPLPRGEVTVGYFGFFTSAWFDWKLVAETARDRPRWRFHIVGFGEPVPIKLPENVSMLGRVAHHRLHSYAQNWDVAMVPFKGNVIARSSDPIKVYEYLALGLPVVTGDLPQLRGYPGVHVATSSSEFAALLEKAARDGLDLPAVRSFLEQSTWQKRSLGLLAAGRRERRQGSRS